MTNEEILGGLKSALERGESLKKAMMTFFNAGYKREEIEDAARTLNEMNFQPELKTQQPQKNIPIISQLKPVDIPPKKIISQTSSTPNLSQPSQIPSAPQEISSSVQKVSSYGENKKSVLIPILIGILIFLFIILASLFIFKQQVINFFASLFS